MFFKGTFGLECHVHFQELPERSRELQNSSMLKVAHSAYFFVVSPRSLWRCPKKARVPCRTSSTVTVRSVCVARTFRPCRCMNNFAQLRPRQSTPASMSPGRRRRTVPRAILDTARAQTDFFFFLNSLIASRTQSTSWLSRAKERPRSVGLKYRSFGATDLS